MLTTDENENTYLHLIGKFLKEFLLNNTIHGQIFLAKRQLTFFEKCFWLFVLITSVFFCTSVSVKAVHRYFNDNTMIALEFGYYRNTTKPSMTVCPQMQLDLKRFETFANEHHLDGPRKVELYKFLTTLANVNYRNIINLPYYETVDETLAQLHITPKHYMSLIYNLTIDYSLLLDANENMHTNAIMATDNNLPIYTRQVLTENGLCYMANSFIRSDYSSSYAINGILPEIPFKQREYLNISKMNFFEEFPAYLMKGMITNFTVFVMGPHEVSDLDHNAYRINERAQISVQQIEFTTEKNLEIFTTVSQRQCRFHHESNLTHFPIYTRNLCLQECRLNVVYELCNCIPHFYPNRIQNPKRICSYKELTGCVAKNNEIIAELHDHKMHKKSVRNCYCEPNCRGSLISVTKVVEIFGDLLSSSKSLELTMEQGLPIIYVRRVIYTFSDLLVSIGGTAGLFLGFSVMGVIEIVYFFTLRLFWYLRGYRY